MQVQKIYTHAHCKQAIVAQQAVHRQHREFFLSQAKLGTLNSKEAVVEMKLSRKWKRPVRC
jgi:hypothetical protein